MSHRPHMVRDEENIDDTPDTALKTKSGCTEPQRTSSSKCLRHALIVDSAPPNIRGSILVWPKRASQSEDIAGRSYQ
jgi:hypothetical protein